MFYTSLYLTCFIASCVSFEFSWDKDIIKKYAEMRVVSDCLGENFIRSWRRTVEAASEKCHNEKADEKQLENLMKVFEKKQSEQIHRYSGTQQNLHQPSYGLHGASNIQPVNYLQNAAMGFKSPVIFKQVGSSSNPYNQVRPPHFKVIPVHNPYHAWGQPADVLNHLTQPQHRLWKRSATEENVEETTKKTRKTKDFDYSSPEGDELMRMMYIIQATPKLKLIRQRMTDKISNITCVLKNMELVNDKGLPNYQYNLDLIERLNVAQDLKFNFIEGQDFCKGFSMCVPTNKLSSPLVSEIGQSIVFLKCLKKVVLQACIAHDLVTEKMEFLDMFGKSTMQEYLKEDYRYTAQKTVEDLQHILDDESEYGFGF